MNNIPFTPPHVAVALIVGVAAVLLLVWLPYGLCLLADRKRGRRV